MCVRRQIKQVVNRGHSKWLLLVSDQQSDAAVSFDVRATDEDGEDVPVPPGETVAGFLARALTSGLAERPKGLSFSPTSVADFGAASRPPPFFLT